MSGINIIVPNADFSGTALRWSPPVPDGLEYANFFTASGVLSRNLAPGKAASTVLGSPTVEDDFAQLTHGSAYIETAAPLPDDFTYFVVAKASVSGYLIGSYRTSGDAQASLFLNSTSKVVFSSSTWNGSAIAQSSYIYTQSPAYPVPPWAIAGRYTSATKVKKIDIPTIASSGSVTGSLPMPTPNANKIRLGYGTAGSSQIAAAFIWSRAISDVELATAYASVKAFYAARGISI